jgi:hypothetical protein
MDSIECFLLAPVTLVAQFEELFDKLFGGLFCTPFPYSGQGRRRCGRNDRAGKNDRVLIFETCYTWSKRTAGEAIHVRTYLKSGN